MAENQWLTIKRDKKTGNYLGFIFQGDKDKYTREDLLTFVDNFNKSVGKEYTYVYELCEDELVIQVAKDVLRSSTINDIKELIDDLKESFGSVEYRLDEIKSTIVDFTGNEW